MNGIVFLIKIEDAFNKNRQELPLPLLDWTQTQSRLLSQPTKTGMSGKG